MDDFAVGTGSETVRGNVERQPAVAAIALDLLPAPTGGAVADLGPVWSRV